MLSKTDYRAEGFLNKRASNAGKKNSVLLIIYWTLMNHIIISGIKNCELFVFFFCFVDAENTVGDALQRKLERLNSTILSQDEQARRQHQYYGHCKYAPSPLPAALKIFL